MHQINAVYSLYSAISTSASGQAPVLYITVGAPKISIPGDIRTECLVARMPDVEYGDPYHSGMTHPGSVPPSITLELLPTALRIPRAWDLSRLTQGELEDLLVEVDRQLNVGAGNAC